jgi:hypothetical protein
VSDIPVANPTRPLPLGPALEDPETSSSLRRYRVRGAIVLLVGMAFIIGPFVNFVVYSDHAAWLLTHGARTTGTVTRATRPGREGSMQVAYTAAGSYRSAEVALSSSNPGYLPGEHVVVIYDPEHPSDVRTPQDKNVPHAVAGILAIGGIIGLILTTFGTVALARSRRWRKILSESPWRAYRAHYLPVVKLRIGRLASGISIVPVGSATGTPILLRTISGSRTRIAKLHKTDGGIVWAAGDPTSAVVLAVPQALDLIGARPPHQRLHSAYRAASTTQRPVDPVKLRKGLRRAQLSLLAQCVLVWVAIMLRTHAATIAILAMLLYTAWTIPLLIWLGRRRANIPT